MLGCGGGKWWRWDGWIEGGYFWGSGGIGVEYVMYLVSW
jgi:hypothetical protein